MPSMFCYKNVVYKTSWRKKLEGIVSNVTNAPCDGEINFGFVNVKCPFK